MKNDIIIFLAKYLVFLIALAALTFWLRLNNQKKLRLATKVILAAVVAMIVAKAIGKLYYDPRPFATQHIEPLVNHSADNGFPSEHTTLAMVIAAAIYFYNRRLASYLFALVVLVGLGRIWAHVHSPVDILGGLIIGGLAVAVCNWLVDKFWPESPADQTD